LLANGAGQYCWLVVLASTVRIHALRPNFGPESGPCFGTSFFFWLTQNNIIIISVNIIIIIISIISIVAPDEHQEIFSADVCLQMLKSGQMPKDMLRSVLRSVHRCSDQCRCSDQGVWVCLCVLVWVCVVCVGVCVSVCLCVCVSVGVCVLCVCLQMFKSVQTPRSMLRSVLKSVHRCSGQCRCSDQCVWVCLCVWVWVCVVCVCGCVCLCVWVCAVCVCRCSDQCRYPNPCSDQCSDQCTDVQISAQMPIANIT
jgi:hypothetical protein